MTRFVDSGFLTITLTDYQKATPYQLLSFKVIDKKIREWRSKQKPVVIY